MRKRAGIDIGGILIPQLEGGDTSGTSLASESDFLALPPIEGAFEGVRWIVEEFAGVEGTGLVSKAKRQSTRELTLKWLHYYDFFRLTGVNPKQVFFRPDRASKAACAAERRHTHFVDNHPGVLGLMDSVRWRILQNATTEDILKYVDIPKDVAIEDILKGTVQLPEFAFITSGWAETMSKLRG